MYMYPINIQREARKLSNSTDIELNGFIFTVESITKLLSENSITDEKFTFVEIEICDNEDDTPRDSLHILRILDRPKYETEAQRIKRVKHEEAYMKNYNIWHYGTKDEKDALIREIALRRQTEQKKKN